MLKDDRAYLFRLSGRLLGLTFFLILLVAFLILPGCSGTEPENKSEYLIRLGERVITVAEFNRAFEIAKIAYDHNTMADAEAAGKVKSRLMNQMIEELLLLEIAESLNIHISDKELDKAISKIKADYPGQAFEDVLLENAVSFKVWKKRLKVRLLMEKVVNSQLEGKVLITPEDIAEYYNKHYRGKEVTGASEKAFQAEADISENNKNKRQDINEIIVQQLRREKTEKEYIAWIDSLKKQYPIQVNQKLWKKIVG